ncbi:MAG: hypothetical protein EZS28_023547 [Streblomastix strix]|uniref:DDE-1 domain-containing protein n=1 Tax=Streblomastix strix TaxID=222440 RepID=A0A5J4VEQ9_9EUKA|nr:MAG: hypothetical protein EZS28_023547 [Streblomastix strix]
MLNHKKLSQFLNPRGVGGIESLFGMEQSNKGRSAMRSPSGTENNEGFKQFGQIILTEKCKYKVAGRDKNTTVLAGICLDGSNVCPAIVVRRKTLDYDIFTKGLRNGVDCIVLPSDKGYENKINPTEWEELLLDGHRAYLTKQIKQELTKANIRIIQLLAYTSHCFQPLDLSTFHSMKSKIHNQITGFAPNTQADKIQRSVMALQLATAPFANMHAFAKAAICQDCTKTPHRAIKDEQQLGNQITKLLDDRMK